MKFVIILLLEGHIPQIVVGPFDSAEEADAYLSRHDERFADLEMDLAKKYPDKIAHTVVLAVNTPAALAW